MERSERFLRGKRMQSYTFGSDNFMNAIALERMRTGENYSITLNDGDFRVFTTILKELALYGECTRSTRVAVAEILGTGTDDMEPVMEWAWSFLSAIAETLGVEGV